MSNRNVPVCLSQRDARRYAGALIEALYDHEFVPRDSPYFEILMELAVSLEAGADLAMEVEKAVGVTFYQERGDC